MMTSNFTNIVEERDVDKILFTPDNNGVTQYEEWSPIRGYEGIYEVSSFGRVKSLKRYNMKSDVISKLMFKQNYYTVHLSKNDVKTGFRVHQLVCIGFLNHTPNGFTTVCDHKNNIKTENFIWNLQLISNRENSSKDSVNKSGVLGVTIKGDNLSANIRIKGKNIHLLSSKSIEECSLYYQTALNNLDKFENPIQFRRVLRQLIN